MKKGVWIFIFAALLIAISAYAQYMPPDGEVFVPGTVETRLPVEFHSVTGSESMELDLKRYFGGMADFVAGETEHVNVTIDKETGVATLSPYDSTWVGTEEVVFATSHEYLQDEELTPKRYVPRRYRNLSKLNITKDKIALISDAFTQQQFDMLIGNLKSEQIEITPSIANYSLEIDINQEMTINLSFGPERRSPLPEIEFSFRQQDSNLTLGHYSPPNDILRFSIVLFAIGAAIFLSIYIKYSWQTSFRDKLITPKEKGAVSRASAYKAVMRKNLRQVKRMVEKEKPSKIYRHTLLLINKFFSKAYGIRGSNIDAMAQKLEKLGVSRGTISKVKNYFSNYRDRAYTSSDITKKEVYNLISLIESILRGL